MKNQMYTDEMFFKVKIMDTLVILSGMIQGLQEHFLIGFVFFRDIL